MPNAAAPAGWRFDVRRESDVPQVVAAAHRFSLQAGLGPLLAAHVATAASELAHNLWMHSTRGGCVLLRRCTGAPPAARVGVEVEAVDDGPGIADLAQAMSEGFSSGGGMGCGLPGAQRLLDDFAIESTPGQGTRVRGCKWGPAAAPGSAAFDALPLRRP